MKSTSLFGCSNPGGGYTRTGSNESGTTPGGFNPGGGGSGNPTDPSGSNGNNNPNQPCDGNGIPSQPQEPSSTLGTQPCNNGTITLPNLGGNLSMNEPCTQLKQINENTNIKAKLTELKNNVGGSLEKGFLIRDIAGNETSDIFLGNADNTIDYPFNAASNQPYLFKTYATAHNHNKDNRCIYSRRFISPAYLWRNRNNATKP